MNKAMRLRGPASFAAGATILAAAAGELWRGAGWIEPFFFLFAWPATLLMIAGLSDGLLKRSFLDERGRLARMAALSVPFWLLFEAFNFRLGNWAYVGLPPTRWIRWGGYAFAFATVLPAILELGRLAESLGRERFKTEPRPWLVGEPVRRASLALGLAFVALPLLWPARAFPLVWGFAFLLLEPWLAAKEPKRSWLRQLADGDAAPAAGLLLSGAACGLLWEVFNYWAGAKWRYTVPWPKGPKLFEMPWAGYLGFPPFALECASAWSACELLRERLPGWAKVAAAAALAGFSVSAFAGIDALTVRGFAAWP